MFSPILHPKFGSEYADHLCIKPHHAVFQHVKSCAASDRLNRCLLTPAMKFAGDQGNPFCCTGAGFGNTTGPSLENNILYTRRLKAGDQNGTGRQRKGPARVCRRLELCIDLCRMHRHPPGTDAASSRSGEERDEERRQPSQISPSHRTAVLRTTCNEPLRSCRAAALHTRTAAQRLPGRHLLVCSDGCFGPIWISSKGWRVCRVPAGIVIKQPSPFPRTRSCGSVHKMSPLSAGDPPSPLFGREIFGKLCCLVGTASSPNGLISFPKCQARPGLKPS